MTRSNQLEPAPLCWNWGHGLSSTYSFSHDLVSSEEPRKKWLSSRHPELTWAFPVQEHGLTLHHVEAASTNLVGDGLFTQSPGVGLGVWGSDCPGLCLSGPEGWRGIAHCGWRGTSAGLAIKLLKTLSSASGLPPHAFSALIGPGISGPCYEVDQPVLEAYSWPRVALKGEGSKQHLDLSKTIEVQLKKEGVQSIIQTGICTYEHPKLHSYRRSGKGLNQLLIMFPCPEVDAPPPELNV